MRRVFLILFILLICGASAWYYRTSSSVDAPQTINAAVLKAGDARVYPDSKLTPGNVLTSDTSTICQPAYYRSVKDVSDEVKKSVYKKYGLRYPQTTGTYELDRLVPIELGGSNAMQNLWPQSLEPRPGFKEKNAVDNFLHARRGARYLWAHPRSAA